MAHHPPTPTSGLSLLILAFFLVAGASTNQDGPLLENSTPTKPTPEHHDESLLLNSDSLPIFLEEPQDSYVVKSRPAHLKCLAAHALKLYFKCNGAKNVDTVQSEFVDPQTGVRIVEAETNVTRDMVEEFFASEKFKCECHAWSGRGSIKSQPAIVDVAYLKKLFEVSPSSTRVEIGHQIEIRCVPPAGVPPPRVYWLQGGQPLQSDTSIIVSTEGHLLIGQARAQDTNNYTCVAENIAGKRTAQLAQITVFVQSESDILLKYMPKVKMFSWLSQKAEAPHECYETVAQGLKGLYKSRMLPLEQHYLFEEFHSPPLNDADFDSKPLILLVGQYSTGKTTFIRYLLERDFPGMRIGPEPTTDRFIAVMYDEKEGVIPGNALVVDPKKQFRPLSTFGNAFLNRFQCSLVKSPVLKGMSIIDTPGILAGEKQQIDRGYDFTGVLEWFAERVDRIILLFDAHKLDISDEFRRSIEALKGHDDKIRIVLNKADMIDHQQLLRVYGALMWSLGKVLHMPEVVRVYIGSFWDQPFRYDSNRKLFEDETQNLFKDLQSLPKNSALRKLNDLIKRARLAKVHAYIIAELRREMPSVFGKEAKKRDLIKNLPEVYLKIQKEHSISPGDFPDVRKMQECLSKHDFCKFHSMKTKLLDGVDQMLCNDIAQLMSMVAHEVNEITKTPVEGGAFQNVHDEISPFGYKRGEGVNAGLGEPDWVVNRDRLLYDAIFDRLSPSGMKISGSTAKTELIKSKLPSSALSKVWKLSDVDRDGFLDRDEFALAMHLINVKLNGNELPSELPAHLRPPQKKHFES